MKSSKCEFVVEPELEAFMNRKGAFEEGTEILKGHVVTWHELLGGHGPGMVTGAQALVVGSRNFVPKDEKSWLVDLAFPLMDELHYVVFHDVEVTCMVSEDPDEINPLGVPLCAPDQFKQIRDIINQNIDHKEAVQTRTHLKMIKPSN